VKRKPSIHYSKTARGERPAWVHGSRGAWEQRQGDPEKSPLPPFSKVGINPETTIAEPSGSAKRPKGSCHPMRALYTQAGGEVKGAQGRWNAALRLRRFTMRSAERGVRSERQGTHTPYPLFLEGINGYQPSTLSSDSYLPLRHFIYTYIQNNNSPVKSGLQKYDYS